MPSDKALSAIWGADSQTTIADSSSDEYSVMTAANMSHLKNLTICSHERHTGKQIVCLQCYLHLESEFEHHSSIIHVQTMT